MRPNLAAPSLLSLHLLWLTALLTAMIALTGCGMGPRLIPSPAQGAALRGNIHGGQQPVAGAHVYLLAAGASGYATASTSLLTSGDGSDSLGTYVLSAADGTFNISGDYTCSPNQQVYALARGGDSGGGTNSAIGLMAILGNCPQAGNFASIPFVEVNEVSTIAAAYSFAGYATDSVHVSSNGSPQAVTGIANAFSSASNLVDLGSGNALATTPAGNGTVPQSTINTLANIIASCVNTADLTVPVNGLYYSSGCLNLGLAVAGNNLNQFTGYTYDTATAAIFIAHNPGGNTAALYALAASKPPFSPALTSQPNDFSLSIAYAAGHVRFGGQLAVDAQGNVWVPVQVTNGASPANGGNGAIEQFSNLGALLSNTWTQTNINHPFAVTIDTSGSAWITNFGDSGVLTVYSSSGVETSSFTPSSFAVLGLSLPTFDLSGNLWLTDRACPGTLLELSSSDVLTQTVTGNGLYCPNNLAFDPLGSLWVNNQQSHTIGKFLNGVAATNNPFSLIDTSFPEAIASDASGNLWVLKQDGAVDVLSGSGAEISGAPYNPGVGGPGAPQASFQALDGAGNDWITTNAYDFSTSPPTTDYNLIEVSHSGTLLTSGSGLVINASFAFGGIALDSSGNLWLSSDNQLFEYIGIAAPVETPIVQALQDDCLAQLPCLQVSPTTIAHPNPIQP
jgi:streptogramin lyase